MQKEIKVVVYDATPGNFVADVYVDGERKFCGTAHKTEQEAIDQVIVHLAGTRKVPTTEEKVTTALDILHACWSPGFRDEFVKQLGQDHRAFQQEFFNLMAEAMRTFAKMFTTGYDERNKHAVLKSKEIMEKVDRI